MIEFDIKSPEDTLGIIKATVHKSGKLGFSTGASKKLDLESNRFYHVATNKSDSSDQNLYLIAVDENIENSFKVSKAGNYYYLRIKHILEEMNIDFRNERVIYDIKKEEQGETTYYKLIRRPYKKRKAE